MADDREQERSEERGAPRPVTAAARRRAASRRRASAVAAKAGKPAGSGDSGVVDDADGVDEAVANSNGDLVDEHDVDAEAIDDVDVDVDGDVDHAGADVDDDDAEDDAVTTSKSAKPASRPSGKPRTARKDRVAGKDIAGKGEADGKTAPKSRATAKKGRPTPTRDGGEKRASVFARLRRFLLEVVDQLRRVIWPTRKQLITYGGVVLVFLVFMVALVFGLDLLLGKAVFWVFG